MAAKTAIPHVALLIETSRSYGRGLLRGVRRYLAEYGPWSVFLEQRSLESDVPSWLPKWKGDGILSRTATDQVARAVRRQKIPAVELRTQRFGKDLPHLGLDNAAVARMAFDHLRECGFRHFGLYALDTEDFFRHRCSEFQRLVSEAGWPCSVLTRDIPEQWERQQQALVRWLKQLPKPVGVMACTDQLGFWILDACQRAEIDVPGQVAVVGSENDESLCTMAHPPLTSIEFNTETIGYEAAKLLDAMMKGNKPDYAQRLFEPQGIIIRSSSDCVAIDDEELARVLQYIRQHASSPLSVDDILRAVPMSRSSLERRMRRLLGRSPNEEILRVRMGLVQRMLIDTDLSIAQIAHRAGFDYPQHLAQTFRRVMGETPSSFRARLVR